MKHKEFLIWLLIVAVLGSMVCLQSTSSVDAHKGTITFTFDDGFASVYKTAYPIMAEHGYHGTAFIITERIGQENRLTLDQLRQLQAAGWDISSHTKTHPNLAKLSENDVIVHELNDSKQWLISHGFSSGARFFAAPYYAYNTNVERLAKRYYDLSFLGTGCFNLYPPTDRYNVLRLGTGNWTTIDEVTSMIRETDYAGGWLVINFHTITDQKPNLSTYTSTSEFRAVVEYCFSNHVQVKSVGEVYSEISAQ